MYILYMDNIKTSIQINKETRDNLKKLRITRFDTYDEIINRLMKEHDKLQK